MGRSVIFKCERGLEVTQKKLGAAGQDERLMIDRIEAGYSYALKGGGAKNLLRARVRAKKTQDYTRRIPLCLRP